MKLLAAGLTAALGFVFFLGSPEAGEKKDPKHTIKEVMKMAHKEGLLKEVTGGTASKEQQKELLELYTSLSQNKPPRGDEKLWQKNTTRMVALAKAVVDGDEKAAKLLAKTVNCAACHKEHKGKG
jgi:hypothetical protein